MEASNRWARILVGGDWVPSHGSNSIEVENPATEEVIGEVPAGNAADVNDAVAAARSAFESWSHTSSQDRVKYLRGLHDALSHRVEAIAELITSEVGTPIRISTRMQAQLPLFVLKSFADLLDDAAEPERMGHSLIVREPVGVVGAITPWNYPLYQLMCKVAAALAAGCTVVVKPSELAPLSAFVLGEAIKQASLPAGVVNVVSGDGPEVGAAIASHPGIDAVSFTGSPQTGRQIAASAAATIKRVTLELGGKSANIILDDADMARAVKTGVNNAFLNSGQTCVAWTRMLVSSRHYEQAVELASAAASGFVPGEPQDRATKLGPVISRGQRDRVAGLIDTGIEEGARLVIGGSAPPDSTERGHWVQATVLADVDPDSTVAQQEIFGPVLAVLPFRTDDDAVSIANNSAYGLHGGVWSADSDRALGVAQRLRTGTVDVNGAPPNPLAPFGGYKQSGYGRELGRAGLEEFLQTKAIQI